MIKINQEFYRYVRMAGIFTYVVKQIHQHEYGSQYVLECQSCTHGYKCLLLCDINDYGQLIFIKTLNDYDEEEERHTQAMWHNSEGIFHPSKDDAIIETYDKSIKILKEDLEKLQESIKCKKEKIAEYESLKKELINLKEGKYKCGL